VRALGERELKVELDCCQADRERERWVVNLCGKFVFSGICPKVCLYNKRLSHKVSHFLWFLHRFRYFHFFNLLFSSSKKGSYHRYLNIHLDSKQSTYVGDLFNSLHDQGTQRKHGLGPAENSWKYFHLVACTFFLLTLVRFPIQRGILDSYLQFS